MTKSPTRWPGCTPAQSVSTVRDVPNHWANFFTIREVLEKLPSEVVRLSAGFQHYRSAINYSEDNLKESRAALGAVLPCVKGLPRAACRWRSRLSFERFGAAMDDDFNSPEACAVLFDIGPSKSTASKGPIWMRRQVWRRRLQELRKPRFAAAEP